MNAYSLIVIAGICGRDYRQIKPTATRTTNKPFKTLNPTVIGLEGHPLLSYGI